MPDHAGVTLNQAPYPQKTLKFVYCIVGGQHNWGFSQS